MRLYHGAGIDSVESLLSGAQLDPTDAAQQHIEGKPGFYLATEKGDAEYFAIRRTRGAIIEFEIEDLVIQRLLRVGAVMRPIPTSPSSPNFAGEEFYVPIECFDQFNDALLQGGIRLNAI